MSVIKSKRGESSMQFLETARQTNTLMQPTGRFLHCSLWRYVSLIVGATNRSCSLLKRTVNKVYIIMNSKERHELRYQRRKYKRLEHKVEIANKIGNYDEVFSFDNLYHSYKMCCKGVGWKASTHKYKANDLLNVNIAYKSLKNKTFKSKGFYEFDIVERGKPRHIQSVHISERVVQRCLCDSALVPILTKTFIHDNGACVQGKGIDFALNRMSKHLSDYYKQNGCEGYILQYDFSKFFDRINHSKLKILLRRKIKNY